VYLFCSFVVTHYFTSVFFFFSSRRRHTRFSRDWSSDVCSSDLPIPPRSRRVAFRWPRCRPCRSAGRTPAAPPRSRAFVRPPEERSEERRVGKEGRSRWSQDQYKKKGSQIITDRTNDTRGRTQRS